MPPNSRLIEKLTRSAHVGMPLRSTATRPAAFLKVNFCLTHRCQYRDPWGVVYPCVSYSKPIGRLRQTGMRLDPIWNAPDARHLQREIWDGQCPQCWTACEAYQSILGNVLAGRWRGRHAVRMAPVPEMPERSR